MSLRNKNFKTKVFVPLRVEVDGKLIVDNELIVEVRSYYTPERRVGHPDTWEPAESDITFEFELPSKLSDKVGRAVEEAAEKLAEERETDFYE
jgi:hypothetical protein